MFRSGRGRFYRKQSGHSKPRGTDAHGAGIDFHACRSRFRKRLRVGRIVPGQSETCRIRTLDEEQKDSPVAGLRKPCEGMEMLQGTRRNRIRKSGNTVLNDCCALHFDVADPRMTLKMKIEPDAGRYRLIASGDVVAGKTRQEVL